MGRRPDPRRISSMYGGGPSAAAPAREGQKTYGVRSLSLGLFPSARTWSPEYTRPGRGVDKMWLEKRATDGKTLLVVRIWDEAGPTVLLPESAPSIRVVVEVDVIDQCFADPTSASLFLRLSRPPTFEAVAVRQPVERQPWPQQVPWIDAEHARVAGYASCALRLELRTRGEFDTLLVAADKAGLPRVVRSSMSIIAHPRVDDEGLAAFHTWLLKLDFRVAFQLEKLVRNGLVHAARAVSLRDMVDFYIVEKGGRATERILDLFADRLGGLDRTSSQKVDTEGEIAKENKALGVAPGRGQRRKTESVVARSPDRPRAKRRKTEPVVLCSDSNSSDSSGSSDDDVLVVGATLPSFRGIATEHASHLSIAELRTLLDRALADSASLGQLLGRADDSKLVRQVTITPTRILLAGPVLADTNTVVRTSGHSQNFITVSVRNEDGSRLNDRNTGLLDLRFKPLFRQGFELGGRGWQFLAWSSSGLKNGSCFFVSPYAHEGRLITPASIHRSIGDFAGTPTGLVPAKYMARIAQAFSSSKPTLELAVEQILDIPDIESRSGSCFSDGVGLVSPQLAADVVRALNLKLGARQKAPTCFQFRIGGAKGMLQVDPSLEGKVVALRPSQIKFSSALTHLEISGIFEAGQAFLNRPLVTLLEGLGIPAQRFLDLQSKATRAIRKAPMTLPFAVELLRDWNLAPITSFTSTLSFLAQRSSTATEAFVNPFVVRCLDAAVVHALRDIKYSARIPLPGCYNVVGVLDVDGCLAADEVYVRIARSDGSTEYLEGTVAISRSPTNHPGDLRLVEAVGRLSRGVGERIRGLTNCVVFSCQGERSLPSMLAGGDLDGDVYLLLTQQSGLVPSPERISAPAAYNPSPTVQLDREVTVSDGADFFFEFVTRDRTGLVATRQLHLADAYAEGLFHPDCLKLAQLHSDCVDSAKSGSFVPYDALPRVPQRGWPDFLTNDSPDSYRSPRALGQLYRGISEEALVTAPRTGTADDPLSDVDPYRALTRALSSISLPSLPSSRLPPPSPALVTRFRGYLPSFSSELSKLLPLSLKSGLDEEALFLSISLGTNKVDKNEKLGLSRRREQAGGLFALVRPLIRDGDGADGGDGAEDGAQGTANAVCSAWSAWHAAVEESEDRGKGRAGASGSTRLVGLRTWGWLALGVLVEQLQAAEKEYAEVIVLDD